MLALLLSSMTHVYLPFIEPNQILNNHTCVILYLGMYLLIRVDWICMRAVTAIRALGKLYPDT